MDRTITLIITLMTLSLLLAGCAGQQTRSRSSVVEYLYPKEDVVVKTSIPILRPPLKVGIAFVPDGAMIRGGSTPWGGKPRGSDLSESTKMELLQKVADHFKKYEFISEIEVIPSPYLTYGGSFANLDQIKTMYGIDVIALVSYDQIQFTDESALTLSYWTLVGAYVVSGEKNDTQTLMDTTVFDIASRKMLFRAPGTSAVKGSATPVNLSAQLRNDSVKGYNEATEQMIKNLDDQLAQFREKIKESPEKAKVIPRPGYTGGGGGAIGSIELLLLLAAVTLTLLRRTRHKGEPC